MSVQELLLLFVVILVLTGTGYWPVFIRSLRELQGKEPESSSRAAAPAPSRSDIEISSQLLGVSPSASWEEIERAYRQKAKIHHPDHGGDADAMRALNQAYAVLRRAKGKDR